MKNLFIIFLALLSNLSLAQTWEFVGLDSMVIYNLKVKGDSIWAGTRDISVNENSGMYFSADQGNSWQKLDEVLGPETVINFSIDETDNSVIYILKAPGQYTQGGEIYKTTNNGVTRTMRTEQLNVMVKDFIVSPLDSSEIYIVTHSIGHEWSIVQLFNKTTNSGESWEFECCPGNQEFGMIMNFTINNTDPNVLYISAASDAEFISRSTDRGDNWEALSGQPPAIIFSDSFIPNRLYTFRYQTNSYSNDGGYTWQSMQGEFSSDAIFISFYQDRISSLIYILMNEGLFYSTTDSIYWKFVSGSDGLPWDNYLSIANNAHNISIDHDNNYTYVGTSNGIYRTGIVTAVNDSEPQLTVTDYSLAQNYPNPFNPSTKIKFSVPGINANEVKQSQFVTLKIYDALGNEVATLVNENKQSGSYEVSFEAKNLTSGVYYYRLQAGSYVETKKMLLLK